MSYFFKYFINIQRVISDINKILDSLYPEKIITDDTDKIPTIEEVVKSFDSFDFILLPHGGQFHRTFDKSIPRKATLGNDKISINASLSPGLNVVIGGPLSGKTLFVDSIYRKICGDFSKSNYMNFNVDELAVINPSGIIPHYINQNFIINILSSEEKDINDIEIIQKVFPIDHAIDEKINQGLVQLKADFDFDYIKMINILYNKHVIDQLILKVIFLKKKLTTLICL